MAKGKWVSGWGAVALLIPSHSLAQQPAIFGPNETTLKVLSRPIEPSEADRRDFDFAQRGFIATRSEPLIRDARGNVVWDLSQGSWAEKSGITSVHPSLLRNYRLLARHGLFKVAHGIYQVRGFDVSNMTVIASDTGYVVIDPLTTAETAKAAFGLVKEQVGDKPIRAVIYTHTHGDHYGGVKGIVNEADVRSGAVQILAPEHFTEETFSEFVLSGKVISRRADYQWGLKLSPGPLGSSGAGVGLNAPKGGTTLILPTSEISKTGETRTIDGVELTFQMAQESEAPAELNVFLRQRKAFLVGEIASCSMHNIQTLRGAPARDALKWSKYLDEALLLYAPDTDVIAGSHCWPRFGRGEVIEYLQKQRDLYKYIHDQTVRLMNRGYTPSEIADQLKLPRGLASEWYNRGNYGSLSHNAKGVYSAYLGWYDGIPAHLNPIPTGEASKRYVALMGGSEKVLSAAGDAMSAGDYRWAAELLQHLVFADAALREAAARLADAYEQLAYRSESGQWRNIYLTAAKELRNPSQMAAPGVSTNSADVIRAMPTPIFLDLLATKIVPEKLIDQAFQINFHIVDRKEFAQILVSNEVLNGRMLKENETADTNVTAEWHHLVGLMMGSIALDEAIQKKWVRFSGEKRHLQNLIVAMDKQSGPFPIVTARPQ